MTSIFFASKTINGVIATQITAPLDAAACIDIDGSLCAAHTVWINGKDAFKNSGGPHAYTVYCLITVFCSIGCGLIFVPMIYKDPQSYREALKNIGGNGWLADIVRGIIMVLLYALSLAVS